MRPFAFSPFFLLKLHPKFRQLLQGIVKLFIRGTGFWFNVAAFPRRNRRSSGQMLLEKAGIDRQLERFGWVCVCLKVQQKKIHYRLVLNVNSMYVSMVHLRSSTTQTSSTKDVNARFHKGQTALVSTEQDVPPVSSIAISFYPAISWSDRKFSCGSLWLIGWKSFRPNSGWSVGGVPIFLSAEGSASETKHLFVTLAIFPHLSVKVWNGKTSRMLEKTYFLWRWCFIGCHGVISRRFQRKQRLAPKKKLALYSRES